MSPLDIKKLKKSYGNVHAVQDISFSLEEGEIFGLLGPNGAGKTTIISIISSLEKEDEGSVRIFGEDIRKKPIFVKTSLGVVPQEITSQSFFQVEEVLHFISGFFGISKNDEWIEFLLHRLELYPHRNKITSQLSGGMKRRLMIAKALVHKPKLLILDEPTAGVDVDLRKNLWEFIIELNKEGMTILLTTHYLEEAERLCNRIGIIHYGKLLNLDKTEALIEKMTTRRITFFLNEEIPKIESPHLIHQESKKITFRIPRASRISELIRLFGIAFENIQDIRIQEGSLEEAFRNIIGGADRED